MSSLKKGPTAVNRKVELDSNYSVEISYWGSGHHLVVNGCDCADTIGTVEKAEEVVALIQEWIELKKDNR